MPTYSLADLIGKTYISRNDARSFRLPDSTTSIYKVFKAGNPVGVVDSWVTGSDGAIYLCFYDVWNNPYYVSVQSAPADTNSLNVQGVQSQEQQNASAASANETTEQKAVRYIGYVLIGAGVVYTLTELGKTAINKRSR